MKHIIWTSDPDFDDWRPDLEEEYPDCDEDELHDIMYQTNLEYLEDEKVNLYKELGRPIFIYGTLGLWNGNRVAYKTLKTTNLNGIFSNTCGDYVTWYVEDGEVKCDDTHHDGTNHYTYRLMKAGYNEDDFAEYSWDNGFEKAVNDLTDPLGDEIAEVYGWKESV